MGALKLEVREPLADSPHLIKHLGLLLDHLCLLFTNLLPKY